LKAIVFFNHKRLDEEMIQKIISFLGSFNIDVFIGDTFSGKQNHDYEPEVIMTFGGDGTVLRAVPFAVERDLPILSFKVGSVGFLAAFELGELESAIGKFVDNRLHMEERYLLEVSFKEKRYKVLNDCAVERGDPSRTTSLEVEIEGFSAYRIVGDGVILSTGTGSTAYNLSIGGALVDPMAKVYQVTPVAPHNPFVGSIIVDSTRKTKVTVIDGKNAPMKLYLDGILTAVLRDGDEIVAGISGKKVKLLRDAGFDFVRVLKRKLAFGGRLKDDL